MSNTNEFRHDDDDQTEENIWGDTNDDFFDADPVMKRLDEQREEYDGLKIAQLRLEQRIGSLRIVPGNEDEIKKLEFELMGIEGPKNIIGAMLDHEARRQRGKSKLPLDENHRYYELSDALHILGLKMYSLRETLGDDHPDVLALERKYEEASREVKATLEDYRKTLPAS